MRSEHRRISRPSTLGLPDSISAYNIWSSKTGVERFLYLVRSQLEKKLRREDISVELDAELTRCLNSAIFGHSANSLDSIPMYITRAVEHAVTILEGRVKMRWRMETAKTQNPFGPNACTTRSQRFKELEHRVPNGSTTHYATFIADTQRWRM